MHEADEILRRRPGLGALVGEAAALRAGQAVARARQLELLQG